MHGLFEEISNLIQKFIIIRNSYCVVFYVENADLISKQFFELFQFDYELEDIGKCSFLSHIQSLNLHFLSHMGTELTFVFDAGSRLQKYWYLRHNNVLLQFTVCFIFKYVVQIACISGCCFCKG